MAALGVSLIDGHARAWRAIRDVINPIERFAWACGDFKYDGGTSAGLPVSASVYVTTLRAAVRSLFEPDSAYSAPDENRNPCVQTYQFARRTRKPFRSMRTVVSIVRGLGEWMVYDSSRLKGWLYNT